MHANGFSLVRQVLAVEDYDGDDLLAPTRLYLDDVRALRRAGDVRALAHVTGGGIEGNLSRVLPEGLRARIDWDAWERPPVFGWLARHVDEDELRRVFNLGIGYCAVVPEAGGAAGDRAHRVIGVLASGEGTNLQALIDAGLPIVAVASTSPGRARSSGPAQQRSRRRQFADEGSMADWLEERGVRLVVLAGYMRLLSPAFLERFDPIVNVHPSLLPAFPGLRAIERAVEAGVHETGVTVHLVDEGIDTGPVLRQEPVPVEPRRRSSSGSTRSSTGCCPRS